MPSSTSDSDRTPHGRDLNARPTAADRPGWRTGSGTPGTRSDPGAPFWSVRWRCLMLCCLPAGSSWRSYGGQLRACGNNYRSVGNTSVAGSMKATVTQRCCWAVRVGYYDIQLPVWEHLVGSGGLIQRRRRHVAPDIPLEDLAADPKFTGRALVAVEPPLLFTGFEEFGGGASYARSENLTQFFGQRLSMRFIEPYFAFDDPDFAIQAVLARLPWPARTEYDWWHSRKMGIHEADRNTYLWSKVALDPAYLQLMQDAARRPRAVNL